MTFDKEKIREKVRNSILLDGLRKEKILQSLDFLNENQLNELFALLEGEKEHLALAFKGVLKKQGQRGNALIDAAFRAVKNGFVRKAEGESVQKSEQAASNILSQLEDE